LSRATAAFRSIITRLVVWDFPDIIVRNPELDYKSVGKNAKTVTFFTFAGTIAIFTWS
jgi:hypothetical protein